VEGDDAGGEEVEADVGEAGTGDELGERFGRGEFEDGAGEISVSGGVAGDGAADAREDAREVETICGAKKRAARLGELKDGEVAAGLEDAEKLGEAAVVVGEVAEAEGGGEEVEGGVGKGKREGVSFEVDGADRGSGAAGKRSGLKGALRIGLATASPEREAEERARGAGLFPALLLLLPVTQYLFGRPENHRRFWRYWATHAGAMVVLFAVFAFLVNRMPLAASIRGRTGGVPWSLWPILPRMLASAGLPGLAEWQPEWRLELPWLAALALAAASWRR
jgi:hypothetical protein